MAGTEVAAWVAAVTAAAAAIGSAGSLFYQGRQFRDQRRLLERQSEVLGLKAQDIRHAVSQRNIQNAARVKLDTWLSRLVPKMAGDAPPTASRFPYLSDEAAVISSVRVCNESEQPVSQLQVRFDAVDARWVRLNDGTTVLPAPLEGLGRAQSVWFDSDYQREHIGSATLRFTDTDGCHWETGMTGHLERIYVRDW